MFNEKNLWKRDQTDSIFLISSTRFQTKVPFYLLALSSLKLWLSHFDKRSPNLQFLNQLWHDFPIWLQCSLKKSSSRGMVKFLRGATFALDCMKLTRISHFFFSLRRIQVAYAFLLRLQNMWRLASSFSSLSRFCC